MAAVAQGAPGLGTGKAIRGAAPPRPRKSLGQHFLTDRDVVRKIISRAGFHAADRVLEIGPGRGALTFSLAKQVARVAAVEKDPRLAELLGEKLARAGLSNVAIHNRDILRVPFEEIFPASPRFHVMGNLPYNISTPLLERLVRHRDRISRAVLMFQSEVADRITANPGIKDYGALTVWVQYHARARVLLRVPGKAFYPRPRVGSAVIEIDFEKPYPRRALEDAGFRRILKGAFAHRRKTIVNSLTATVPSWSRPRVRRALEDCGIDPGRRAETLDMEDFLCLEAALSLTDK